MATIADQTMYSSATNGAAVPIADLALEELDG
jgi:hypothetical protein